MSKSKEIRDLSDKEIRRWTQAALQVGELMEERERVEHLPLFVVERVHAMACEMEEHDTFTIQAGLLVSILARMLRREIRCANGHPNPHLPDNWDGEAAVFCTDCWNASSRGQGESQGPSDGE